MLLVNIIHVNTIAMNKIKNIYRSLILLLSLVLMPVEGWGETAVLTKDNGYYKLNLKNAYLDANNNSYKYTYFFIEFIDKSEKIIDIASWSIKKNNGRLILAILQQLIAFIIFRGIVFFLMVAKGLQILGR